ncbi:MAG: M23 family metallopeptidase [Steroidobacteraceae bacterium]|jgi:hypothetical protein|nr:M23 family metallopeptidase [Steroidobacteraceae bacterium]
MDLSLIALPAVGQVLLPLGLLAWQVAARPALRQAWFLQSLVVLGYLAGVLAAGLWLAIPRTIGWLWLALAIALAARGARRIGREPGATSRGLRRAGTSSSRARVPVSTGLAFALRAVPAVAVIAWIAVAFAGHRPLPGTPLELRLPFGEGRYLVVNGGSHPLVNAHLATLAPLPRYAPWRGQSYGVDFVRVDALGVRARGLQPQDPQRYAIFATPVLAPCDGEVVRTEDGRPDMPPPQPDPDRTRLAGNHVILRCDGQRDRANGGTRDGIGGGAREDPARVEVVLAHLRRGTVRVAAGRRVAVGEVLGEVGNSGNSNEPHLHLSAQRRDPGDPPLGGEPVPVTFGGDAPVRNEVYHAYP